MKVKVKLEEPEIRRAYRRILEQMNGPRNRRFLGISAIVISIILYRSLLSLALKLGFHKSLTLAIEHAASIFFFVGIYILVFSFLARYTPKVQYFSPDGMSLSAKEAHIDDEGFHQTSRYETSHTRWDGIMKIREDYEFIFFYVDIASAYFIPKRFFNNPEDASAFATQARDFWDAVRKLGDDKSAENAVHEQPQNSPETETTASSIHDSNPSQTIEKPRKFSVKAILIGMTVGLIGSSLASVIAAMAFDIPLAKMSNAASNLEYLALDLLLSLAAVFLSGYVAGKLGKNHPLPNALFVGAVQLVISVMAFAAVKNTISEPVWYTAAALLLTIPAAYLGGLAIDTKPENPNAQILFEVAGGRLKFVGRSLSLGLLYACLLALIGYEFKFSDFVWTLGIFFLALIVMFGFYTMTVRIIADDDKISTSSFLGPEESLLLREIQYAGIHFRNVRGTEKVLRLQAISGKLLDIYIGTNAEKKLSEIQNFIAAAAKKSQADLFMYKALKIFPLHHSDNVGLPPKIGPFSMRENPVSLCDTRYLRIQL